MIKLLIVDDEKKTREGLLRYIPWSDLGIDSVECAGDGEEALALAAKLQPDIMLCDIKMPDMNGIELANRIKDILPVCKVIFLSAYSDKEYLKSAIHLRAFNYLEKPVSREELKSVIKDAVQEISVEILEKSEQRDLVRLAEENAAILREKLVLSIINGQAVPNEVSRQMSAVVDDMEKATSFMAAVMKIDLKSGISSDNIQLNKGSILSAVERVYADIDVGMLSGFKDLSHIVLLFYGRCFDGCLSHQETLMRLKADIQEILQAGINVFMGLGRQVKYIDQLPVSCETAYKALQRCFFVGYDKTAGYIESESRGIQSEILAAKQLIKHVKEHNREKALSSITSMNVMLKQRGNITPSFVRNLYFDLLIELNQATLGYNISLIDTGEKKENLYETIAGLPVLDDLADFLTGRLLFFFNRLESGDAMSSNVRKIIKYVADHYQDETLTINSIASNLFLTPTYLCMIFKNGTGKTINQYITEVRIDRAKELLKGVENGKMKLAEISQLIGYQSPNHFAKTFKRETGMNPSEYRERLN